MTLDVKKSAIDIGIVTNNIEAMMTFYKDTLELEYETTIPMPGGGQMNRFKVGDSVIKVIDADPKPELDAAPGGIRGSTGYRYWTITVGNLAECVDRASAAGSKIIVAAKEVRPGITIAIIADPDGNWVELLENA